MYYRHSAEFKRLASLSKGGDIPCSSVSSLLPLENGIIRNVTMMAKPSKDTIVKYSAAYSTVRELYVLGVAGDGE